MKTYLSSKTLILICVLMILSAFLGGCAKTTEGVEEVIIGKWAGNSGLCRFYEDGTGDDEGESFTYDISGNVLTKRYEEQVETYIITISDKNHLRLEEKEIPLRIDLFRCDAQGHVIIGE